jgi:triosephosphate isomerase
MRKSIIAGNWKMNKTNQEAIELVSELKDRVIGVEDVEIILCPPFTSLFSVNEVIKDSPIKLGAQNMFWEEEGAYTGEISPSMIKNLGGEFVIIGHSERRKYFEESDEIVNKKIKLALSSGLVPIVCIGETLEQREQGIAEKTVIDQLTNGLSGVSQTDASKLILAYEPIWAIGTGKTATPEVADGMHSVIRNHLVELYSSELSDAISILYGGSVKPDNIDDLMKQENIDGALVGGASLNSESFACIVKFNR